MFLISNRLRALLYIFFSDINTRFNKEKTKMEQVADTSVKGL